MAQVTLKIKLEDDASQNLMKIRDELNKLGDANKPATDGNDKFKKSLITGAIAGATAMAVSKVTSTIKGMVSDVMKASDALDAYDYTLSTMGYGKEQIKKSQATMRDFAKNSVYDLTSVIGTAQSLATNGVKDFEAVTKGLGGFNAIAGGTKESFDILSNGMMKVNGEGKLTNEVWNSFQSALKGTKMKDLENELRNITGETGNFKKALTDGKISADDMNTAIKNMGLTKEAQEFVKGTAFFEGAIENLKSNVFEGLLNIFDELKPSITMVTNTLAKIADVVFKVIGSAVSFITQNKDWLLPLIVGFTAFNIASKIASVGLLGFLKGLPLVTGAIKMATIAQTAFNAVLNANPIGIVVGAIALAITALVLLYNKCEWFRNIVNAVFQGVADFFITVWQGIADFFVNLWNGITSAFQGIWEGIKIFFIALIEVFKLIITNYFNFYINIFNMLSTVFIAIWNGIKAFFTIIWDVLKNVVITTVNVFRAIFSTIYNIFATPFQTAFNVVRGIFNSLRTIVSSVVSSIAGTFQKVINAIVSPIRTAVNTAKGILNTLSGAINTVVSGVGSAIGNMFVSAVNAIKSTINNYLISPINSAMGILGKLGIKVSIPYLATGGIIDGATLAVVGEAGREAVVPMTNKSVMSELANEINKYRGVSVPSNNGSTNNNTNNEYIFNVTTQNFDEKSIKRFLLREAKGCGF